MSNQLFSQTNINPASIGTSNYANAFLFVRKQWLGFSGSPFTQMFNVSGFLSDYSSGVGLSVLNDKVGRNNLFEIKFAYAYNVKTGENSYLALGANVGFYNRRLNEVNMVMPEPDPELMDEINNGKSFVRPDADFGLMFTSPKFSIGLSATHLIGYAFAPSWYNMPMQTYLYSSYTFGNTEGVFIQPYIQATTTIYTKTANNIQVLDRLNYQLSGGFVLGVKDNFYFGVAYRHADAIVGMIGFAMSNSIKIGYSYDFKLGNAFSNIRNYGSHEIILNYRLLLEEREVSADTPRFFD